MYEPSSTRHNFLLVGQGLAGSLLAHALRQRGQRVRVVETGLQSSSRIAAGVCNPVTGRRPTCTWLADELFSYLHEYYPQLEAELGTRFFHPTHVYRPYRSLEEQNDFIARTAWPGLQPFLSEADNDQAYAPAIRNPLGGLKTHRAAWVDVPALLDAFRRKFISSGIFQKARFEYEALHVEPNSIRWQDERFDVVVFCEGVHIQNNPFFKWLPLQPVKGQTITVRIDGPDLPGIVNQSGWVLPLGGGRYRVGATYEWDDLTWQPTDRGYREMTKLLNAVLRVPYTVETHQAGVRPAVRGRRPLLGRHPEYPSLAVFNGLGSKGVSLGPYFANQLAGFLVEGKELDEAVNISRFVSLSYRQNQISRTE